MHFKSKTVKCDARAIEREIARNWAKTAVSGAALAAGAAMALKGGPPKKRTALLLLQPAAALGLQQLLPLVLRRYAVEAAGERKIVDAYDAAWRSSGLKTKPELIIVGKDVPQAAATGAPPLPSWVLAFRGLSRARISDAEKKAVFAHELCHIKNRDMLILAAGSTLAQLAVNWLDERVASMLKNQPKAVQVAARLGAQMLPIVLLRILQRSREACADATAARMTGNPAALSGALKKIVGVRANETKRRKLLSRIHLPWWLRSYPTVKYRLAALARMQGGK